MFLKLIDVFFLLKILLQKNLPQATKRQNDDSAGHRPLRDECFTVLEMAQKMAIKR